MQSDESRWIESNPAFRHVEIINGRLSTRRQSSSKFSRKFSVTNSNEGPHFQPYGVVNQLRKLWE